MVSPHCTLIKRRLENSNSILTQSIVAWSTDFRVVTSAPPKQKFAPEGKRRFGGACI
jgi:hypothetical protein